MSNVTVFNPSKAPSFARRGGSSAIALALTGGGGNGASGKNISIKGGVFRLISDGKEIAAVDDRHLDVVIVGAAPKIGRTFYAAKYEEGKTTAPICWSADGDKPDTSIESPQHSNCADCPQNIQGSGEGNSRACRFSQRIAVVLANDVEGDALALSLPATSIFGKDEGGNMPLQAYARWLAAQDIKPEEVVTRMRFDTKAAVPKLFFKTMRWLTDEEFESASEKIDTEAVKKMVTLSFSASQQVAAPLVEGNRPKAAAKKKEVVEEIDDSEPEVREKAAPTNAVPKKSGIAATVAAWDTDD
ncbi:hypothetical protein EB118_13665 [bacterium]|nr:hypothetical protein [bacterium]